ncbi:MAG: OadG family protein [Clostridiales bacterium]|nr:OadG family protein [Clostridiales bacterium]
MNMVAAFITWDSAVMKQAGLNTILGIGIVFLVLILISFIISLFKYINKIGAPKKVEEPKVSAPAAPVEEVVDVTDDLEIVAVITAAISAYEEEMGGTVPADGLVVRSIKKVNKQKWLNA